MTTLNPFVRLMASVRAITLWLPPSLLWLLLVGCQAIPATLTKTADVKPGEVAFEIAGPGGAAIVVPVRVNDRGPFQFVVDTGATLTCVHEQLANELGLPRQPGLIGVAAGLGTGGPVRVVQIESIVVGTAEAQRLTGCALDLESLRQTGIEIDGLLGLNFLRSFRVTFDFQRSVLKLERPQSADPGAAK